MGGMVYRLVVASLFVAATAHAQAPGEVAPAPAPVAPAAQMDPCACGGYESVMANRWAVGLSFGHMSIAPKATPDDKTEFGVGELSLRFRATLHLELEAAFAGGRQQLGDNTQGDLQFNSGMIDLRYRFAPEQRWNWWLMGGLGGMSVARYDATDAERKAVEKPMVQLGIGLERRFHHFAIDAELRAIGVGEKQQDQSTPVMATAGTSPSTMTPPPSSAPMPQGQSGGQLTIGASYYF